MNQWEDALKKLRRQYRSRSNIRLVQIQNLLDALRKRPEEVELLRELRIHFHSFAGSGGSYGFPLISQLAEHGERDCELFLKQQKQIQNVDLLSWESLLEQLRLEFSKEPFYGGTTSKITQQEAFFHILVVDSFQSLRPIIERLIDQEGFFVHLVSSQEEAIKHMESKVPNAVITNTLLADGSGYELTEQIRKFSNGEQLLILLVSDSHNALDKVNAISSGADGYFGAPIDIESLVERLKRSTHNGEKRLGRVLSLEDDPDQAEFISMILKSAGYQVHICSHPKSFEETLSSFCPDLVLMDILLPDVNGFELVRYLRQNELYATLPIIFLTSQEQVQAKIESLKSGGDDYLTKPVFAGLLLSTVAARIERANLLKTLLNRDSLTMLLNHSAFLECAKKAIAEKKRYPEKNSALIMIDLDHFKSINDRYGHPVGDQVIKSLSALLRKRVRQYDTIGRYGGEEFIILLEDLQEDETFRLAVRLLEEFSSISHQTDDGRNFYATFSAGVSLLQIDMSLDNWKKSVDDALYTAKTLGRNRVITTSMMEKKRI